MGIPLIKTFVLASRDYRHEWQVSFCFVIALAAVLGPMMVLFGLKFGIVGAMVDQLVEDPGNREIRPVSSGRYDHGWLESVSSRPDVAFLVPRTRSIAATVELASEHSPRNVRVELIPSAEGDPTLPPGQVPEGVMRIVLSQSTAKKLQVEAGDTVDGSVTRQFRNQKERVHLPLTVTAVAPAQAYSRDGAFVSVTLLEALEDFRDGRAVPRMGWSGDPAGGVRSYPSFRLYARSIYDVAGLANAFTDLGVDVYTHAADIERVQRMNRNLTAIYWAIAVIGLFGFSVSLAANLWANVDRKRKELSVLRLVGFRTLDIAWFPIVQALYTAVLGWALAAGLYQAVAWAINEMMASQLEEGQKVCRLLPQHYAIALAITCAAAVIAAGLAGLRSARVEPSEGLRDL
jgi:putative ABC transport system permease protein